MERRVPSRGNKTKETKNLYRFMETSGVKPMRTLHIRATFPIQKAYKGGGGVGGGVGGDMVSVHIFIR